MKCRDLMKINIQWVGAEAKIFEAARKMQEMNVGFLPVMEQGGKVLGTVTDRDIAIRCVAERLGFDEPVRLICSQPIVAVTPEDPLNRAETLMMQHHVARMLVLDNLGRCVGVISLSDIADQESPAAALRTIREVAHREVSA